ncbi:MAG: hypothetical protein H6Q68_401 [Firmicutes bacterium]|nr:hypothetical protein [Bacillota bacterium]
MFIALLMIDVSLDGHNKKLLDNKEISYLDQNIWKAILD